MNTLKKFSTIALLSDEEINENSKWNIQNGDKAEKGISAASDYAYALLAAGAALGV